MKKLHSLLLIFPLLFMGCDQVNLNKVVVQSVQNQEVKSVAESMSELSDTDCVIIYKQFSGLAEFIKNTDYLKDTAKVDKTIGVFHGIYYLSSSNEKWLNFIEKWLDEKGYDDVKKIVETVSDESKEISKKQIIADFQILAEGAKLRLESKGGHK